VGSGGRASGGVFDYRKPFTISEQVEMGQVVEEEIGSRQGTRTDLSDDEDEETELAQNIAQE